MHRAKLTSRVYAIYLDGERRFMNYITYTASVFSERKFSMRLHENAFTSDESSVYIAKLSLAENKKSYKRIIF